MKILYVEDEIAHVELVQRTLDENLQDGFVLYHAVSLQGAMDHLEAEPDIDLVLADLRLPDGSGLELLNKIQERQWPPAVVLVTGQGDQEAAVAALKAGAADYLVKQSDYLHRLPIIISNAVAQNRLAREQAAKREAEIRYQSLIEQTPAVVFLDNTDEKETTIYISPRVEELTGYTPEEWRSDHSLWESRLHPEDRARIVNQDYKKLDTGDRHQTEYRFIRKDGRVIWIKEDTNLIRDKDGKPLYWQGIMFDSTKDRENATALQRQLKELTVLHLITIAGTESNSEDEMIQRVVHVASQIYNEVCGVLLINDEGNRLIPHPSYFGADIDQWSNGLRLTEGITGKSVLAGKSIRVGDVTQIPEYIAIAAGIRSELCVPIRVNKKIIGILNVESRITNAYDEEDEQFLNTVTSSLGTALERLRLSREEQQRARELNALYQATKSLGQSLRPEVIANNLIETMDELLGYKFASIYLVDDETGILIPVALSQRSQDLDYYEKDSKTLLSGTRMPGQGIIGWVAQHGQPIRTGDVSRDERYLPVIKNIQSELCVPLIVRDKVIGAINIETTEPNAYSERDESLLTALANSVAIAFENAGLYESELVRREQAETLQAVTSSLSTSLDINILYRIILDSLSKLVRYESASIFLERADGDMEIVAAAGFPETEKIVGRKVQKSAKWDELALTRKSIIIPDAQADPRFEKWDGGENIRGWMSVPMITQNKVIGFINLDSHKVNTYTERDATLVQTFANSVAVAIQNAFLFSAERKQREREESMLDLMRVTTSSLELNEVIQSILRHMLNIIPSDSGTIQLLDGSDLRIAATQGFGDNILTPGQLLPLQDFPVNRQVIESMQPLRINNTTEESGYRKIEGAANVNSFMAVPLIYKGSAIGLATLDSHLPDRYAHEDAELALALANHAAIALANARLFQEESRRTKIIETMVDIANEIATTLDIVPILDKITKMALDLLRANHVAIYLLHDDNNTIKVISAQGTHRYQLLSHSLKIGEGITGSIVANGKPEIINDIASDPRRKQVPGTPENEGLYETMMSSPLVLRGRPIGAINAWRLRSDGYFSQVELNFLINIAHQVSIAIESSNLYKETVRRAQEFAAIAEVGRDISATLQLDTVLNRIASYAMELLYADSSAVYLVDTSRPLLNPIAAKGLEAEQIMNDPLEMGIGILGNIAKNKAGEIVNNTITDPRAIIIKGTEMEPHEHIMGVPVLEKDQLTGLVVVWRNGVENEFRNSDLDFLGSLAQQAATAIKNASLYDETQRRLKELETINRVSSSLRMTLSQDEMLNILLTETLNMLKAENGSVWIYDSSTHMLVQRIARGSVTRMKYQQLHPGEGIVGHVFATGEVYISPELKNDPLLFPPNRESILAGFGGAGIPILSTAGVLGVLMVQMESDRQVADYTSLMTTLAEITGNAIHRAHLFDQSQEQVRRLTTLRDIDSAIASSTDLRVTLNILTEHTLKHLNVDAVDILLYHHELQSLAYYCSAGFKTPSPTRPLTRIGEGLAGQVVMKGRTDHVLDLQQSSEAKRDPLLAREGFVSYIGIPLIVKGQIKGVFEVFQRSPLTPNDSWMQFLHTLASQAAIAIDNSQLFDNLQRSNQELTQAYDTTLEGWARALELRDRETEGHTRRVTLRTTQLARRMGVSEDELVNVYRGVLLHDIGKMGVPDQILRKTGPLTDSEWVEMRKHPQYAFDLLFPIPYLRPALDIPYCHHEHWDGSGYPRGLKGEQIPLAARIFSVVDIWDALLSDRPYRSAWSRDKVIEYLKEISGKILDPKVVDTFLKMIVEEEEKTG